MHSSEDFACLKKHGEQTDGRMNNPKAICPSNFFKGIKLPVIQISIQNFKVQALIASEISYRYVFNPTFKKGLNSA